MPAAILSGLGTALPERAVSNEDLAARFDTTDEWIRTRTGIRQRHWARPGESTGDLAVAAGERALASARATDVDLLVLATTTPDKPCPATAPSVAARLGLGAVAAFDVAAVCSGFVYALSVAAGAIVSRQAARALVIGAETYSTILDPDDRSTSVIFGDGAGAVVLRDGSEEEPGALLAFDLGSDGHYRDHITVTDGHFAMRGKEVFAHAVRRMSDSSQAVLKTVGWTVSDVDHCVAHQANIRILHSVADRLGLDRAKTAVHLDRVGNTSAASIPLALADRVAHGALTRGDRVLLTAFGGGFTWGSTALEWPDIDLKQQQRQPPTRRRHHMSKPIEDKLLSIMAEKFDIEPGKLTPTTSFEAMDVDSLVLVELSVIVEKQFGVRLSDAELGDAGTIRGAALLLRDNGVPG